MLLDSNSIREQFPIFEKYPDLVYLDSAATCHVPQTVLNAMYETETCCRSNPHRGMHALADKATQKLEDSRAVFQKFVNAKKSHEILFTKSCTESLNIVAKSWGAHHLKKGDVVLLSLLEHHSNIVPWQQLSREIGIQIQWIPLSGDGTLDMNAYDDLLVKHSVKVVAVTMQSNVLGVQPPVKKLCQKAHANGAIVVLDAAQYVGHAKIDVQDIDCDFLALSAHKAYGPQGVGILYGKREHLENMPAHLGGGMMIQQVTTDGFTESEIPYKFEAGTQNVAGAAGAAAAVEWLEDLGWQSIESHERQLLEAAYQALGARDDVDCIHVIDSTSMHGCISFVVDGAHTHDLTHILGAKNICLRAGHHCAQPLHDALGITASNRLSVGIYNTLDDIERFADELSNAITTLR